MAALAYIIRVSLSMILSLAETLLFLRAIMSLMRVFPGDKITRFIYVVTDSITYPVCYVLERLGCRYLGIFDLGFLVTWILLSGLVTCLSI